MIMELWDVRRLWHLLPGVTDQKAVDGHLCIGFTKSMKKNIMSISFMGKRILWELVLWVSLETLTESESPSQGSMRPVYTPDSVSQPGGAGFIHKIFLFLYSNIREIKSCIQIVDKSKVFIIVRMIIRANQIDQAA